MDKLITIAIPKGRLLKQITDYLAKYSITVKEESRKLDYIDTNNNLRFLFVKNSDVPTYVNYGVASLGICGTDNIYESGFEFLNLGFLPFGTTRICLAGFEKDKDLYFYPYSNGNFVKDIRIATKFERFTKDYFGKKSIPIEIIKLSGSIELAPILGLSHFIVDLVETGTTLKENNLSVIEELGKTEVEIIANPSLYKINYKNIDKIINKITI
ncbi:MAG TPA: ATP phosphoribosyltransferase [Spirochaetota bacterium]|nr:ATP phosphoribosyltransferase [Spirochaetota bacterium]